MILDGNGRPANDFEFSFQMKAFFQTELGAGSIIGAKDEGIKGQITVTKKFERPIIEQIYQNIPTGTKTDLGEKSLFDFRLFPTGKIVQLPLLYRPSTPKKSRDELRLYMNEGKLRPKTGMFWLVFVRDNELWLASVTAGELINIEKGNFSLSHDGLVLEHEEEYQENVNTPSKPQQKTSISTSFQRDPNVAWQALKHSHYSCEMLPEHPTFEAKRTGNPFLEAHHFVPMMQQRHFDANLDVVKNICILNPYAHRMLHHATYSEIEPYVKKLAEPREAFLNKLGLSVDRVLKIYGGP